jgi:hypothetical protein
MKRNLLCTILTAFAMLFAFNLQAATEITPGDNATMLSQNSAYTISGVDASWYVNPSFFSKNADGTYKFLAVTGTYQVKTDATLKYVQVKAFTNGAAATLQDDGTGALWIIGNKIGMPAVRKNEVGWNTDGAICMAQVKSKVYQFVGTVGEELGSSVDFKFFLQPDWGNELDGKTDDSHLYLLTSNSDVFGVGDGNGHDNGNLYLKDGASYSMGDKVTITVDCTAGAKNAVLTTTVEKSAIPFNPTFNNVVMTLKDGSYLYAGALTQGATYEATGATAFGADDWYYDPDFFTKTSDGKYTFNAVSGNYAVVANFDLYYFKVFAIDDSGNPATYDTTTGLNEVWAIGNFHIGKPSFATNAANWWTDLRYCNALAQVKPKVYQLTLTAGKQVISDAYPIVDANTDISLNFKFFGQPGWGTEFHDSPALTLQGDFINSLFRINKDDNSNLTLVDGKKLTDGQTYVFTLDCTDPASAILSLNTITTGINSVEAQQPVQNDNYYTISGVRVSKPAQRGIYIHNGKKMVVK